MHFFGQKPVAARLAENKAEKAEKAENKAEKSEKSEKSVESPPPDVQTLDEMPLGKYGAQESAWPISGEQFRKHMQQMAELIVAYVRDPTKYKVLTTESFGFLYNKLPRTAPESSEPFDRIMTDVHEKILPGLMHWQSPNFHGYFACGQSYADMLAETLIAGLSVVPFAWISAPSITELEMVVINWFAQAIGLPPDFYFAEVATESKGGGVICNSSSEIIFVCVMAARTKCLRRLVNDKDPARREKEAHLLPKLVAYTNIEAHSSIEKACRMAMIPLKTVRPDEKHFGLTGELLERAIKEDVEAGRTPFYIHASFGTTNTAAMDKIDELAALAKKYNCWLHLDAAYAGNALICPEFRPLARGIELVDSMNCNMHKMLLTTVPMSFLWCRHKMDIENAFAVHPTYLKDQSETPAFRHWDSFTRIQLSRRSLALKGWFVMRSFGLKGLQEHMVRMADRFRELIKTDERYEFVGQPVLTLTAFRLRDGDPKEANRLTTGLCEYLNRSNQIFVTHAKPMGIDVVRVNFSHNFTTEEDVDASYRVLSELTEEYLAEATTISAHRCLANENTPINASPQVPSPRRPSPRLAMARARSPRSPRNLPPKKN
ncbi:putative Aromatic-L-amino-acid decarboxylase [Aphelenchoides fujianensis]|nr:putative Aromatic-L-amino-acid decarboxylase [Aphelenchoides fujianensis]